MGQVRQEKVGQELDSYGLTFRPFTNIFFNPEKTTEENKKETKVGSEPGYYNSLISRFIIGDDVFKCLDDTKLDKSKNDNGLEIQANKKSVDKLKRKIKRTLAEKDRHRKEMNRRHRQRGDTRAGGDGRKKGDKKGRRKGGKRGGGRGGGSKSPSPSRSGRKGKKKKDDKIDRKGEKISSKGGRHSSSLKGSRDKKDGEGSPKVNKRIPRPPKRTDRRDRSKKDREGSPRVNKRIPRPPKRRDHQDRGKKDREGSPRVNKRIPRPPKRIDHRDRGHGNESQREINSSYHRRRRGSGSPPPDLKDDIRARGGRYGKRRRKKFRYRKAIMRRIKARYMEKKAKKIFKAKMKRGHKIKYWRKTPIDIERQRRIGLEREYGRKGAYEILAYEHRLMRIREAKEELARLEKKGMVGEFHSGDEDEVQDNRTLEQLQDAIKKRKLLKVSDKVQRLLKKSAAHLKLNSQKKKKKGPNYLQTIKEFPKGFYEKLKDKLTINDTKYLNTINKNDLLYNPNKEERFVIEEVNYEDPWEEPERNRIMKLKQKRVKIKVLKDFYKKKLSEEKKKRKKIPTTDGLESSKLFATQEDMKSQNLSGNEENLGGNLIKGSFQRQVINAWRTTKKNEEERRSPFNGKQLKMRPHKYEESLEKEGHGKMSPDMVEASEDSGDEYLSKNNNGSYEEYSDIDTASGSNSDGNSEEETEEDGSSDDERVYEERDTEYSGTDEESGSEVGDESQTYTGQGSVSENYSSYVNSLSEYSEHEQDSYSDASYNSE